MQITLLNVLLKIWKQIIKTLENKLRTIYISLQMMLRWKSVTTKQIKEILAKFLEIDIKKQHRKKFIDMTNKKQ